MITGRELPEGTYGYSALTVGDRITTDHQQVTEAMIDQFADLTGDRFEIHMTDAAAARHGFAARVAHGLLVLSLVDGLKNKAAAQFKAQASLGWTWTFKAPVLAGDTIGVRIRVESMAPTGSANRAVVGLRFDVTNQHDLIVQQGDNKLMVYA